MCAAQGSCNSCYGNTQLPFRHTAFDCSDESQIPNGHNPSIPKMSFSTVFRFNRPRKGPPNALLGERRLWVFVARRRTGGAGAGRPSMRLAAKKQDELTTIQNTPQKHHDPFCCSFVSCRSCCSVLRDLVVCWQCSLRLTFAPVHRLAPRRHRHPLFQLCVDCTD